MGRIHLGRQDLSGLQTRKMKGLKRSRDVVADEDTFLGSEDEIEVDAELPASEKRIRLET